MATIVKRRSFLVVFISCMITITTKSNTNPMLSRTVLNVVKKAASNLDELSYEAVKPIYDKIIKYGSIEIDAISQINPALKSTFVAILAFDGALILNEISKKKYLSKNRRLIKAIDENNIEDIKKAIKDGANINHRFTRKFNKQSLLKLYFLYNNIDFHVIEYDKNAMTPLCLASKNGNKKVVKLLVESGASISEYNNFYDTTYGYKTPLIIAIENNDYEIAKYLLSKGANQFHSIESPLSIAILNNNYKIAKLLLKHGAKITSSILDEIISRNNINAMEFSIKNGADISGKLHNKKISYEMLKLLINNSTDLNSDLNSFNYNGLTPLQEAVLENDLYKLKILLPHVDDIDNHFSNSGLNALHIAVEKGYVEIVSYLLDNGASANAKTIDGRTPLDIATSLNNSLMIKILRGASSNSNMNPKYNENKNFDLIVL